MGGTKRRRVGPTGQWEQIELLCVWPEQLAYEEIRPTVLFGSPVSERAEQTGASERTLYRKAARFDREGMDSLFDSSDRYPPDPDLFARSRQHKYPCPSPLRPSPGRLRIYPIPRPR